uniref:Putative secreted protein n=1 Tax=Ixodes ricinus TaxID=34613 RepID=V5IBN4_IXORI
MAVLNRILAMNVIFMALLPRPSEQQVSQGQGGPFYYGSFKAIGEIIRSNPNTALSKREVQYFEEIHDKTSNTASLKVRSANGTTSYFQDTETRQTFYFGVSENSFFCKLMGETMKTKLDEFKFYNSDDGRRYFFLSDVLAIRNWTRSSNLQYARNISTEVWVATSKHKEHHFSIAVALTGANWSSTALNARAPVTVDFNVGNDGEKTRINIFSFEDFEGTLRYDIPQLPDGVYCDGYKKSVPPPKLEKITTFNYRAEMWSSTDQLVRTSDVWIDMNRALYRMDFEPVTVGIGGQRSIIVSGNEKTIYTIAREPTNQCNMTALTELDIDPQMVTDPRYVLHMKPSTFFSGNKEKLSLSYKKQTEKRGIPCHVWQVLRDDWPPESIGVKTLWEWCVAMPDAQDIQGTKGNVYLVNLDLSVLEVPKEGQFLNLSVGTKLSFRFYDALLNPPELIDLHGFDISPCYEDNEMADMKIIVELSSEDYKTLFAAFTLYNPRFLSAWRRALEKSSGLPESSLRITRIKAAFDDNALVVQFTMLDRFPARAHTGITDNQVTLKEMKSNLLAAIDAGKLGIQYEGMNLVASTESLLPATAVPDTTVPGTTVPGTGVPGTELPTTSKSSTDEWDVITDNDDKTTTVVVVSTDAPLYEYASGRYSAATIAGTTTAMFVLGALLGASGTYVKYKVIIPGEPVRYRFWA